MKSYRAWTCLNHEVKTKYVRCTHSNEKIYKFDARNNFVRQIAITSIMLDKGK